MTATTQPRHLQQARPEPRLQPDPATVPRLATGLRPLSIRRLSGAGFDVVLHEGARRATRVIPGADRLCVVVADQGGSAPMADDLPVAAPASSTTVWVHSDGSLSVRASWGPPALLVRGEQVLMLPEVPGTTGQAVLHPGDRLVVLSSVAYESAPQEIVRLLHEDPPSLARAEGGALLGVLLGQVPDGGGAVITRSTRSGARTDGRPAR